MHTDLKQLAEEVMFNRRVIVRVHELAQGLGRRAEAAHDFMTMTEANDEKAVYETTHILLRELEADLWRILEHEPSEES